MRHSVDTDAIQKILDYLASRPYGEVAKLIENLQKTATVIKEEPKEDQQPQ